MKRTLKRELKVFEIVKSEAMATSKSSDYVKLTPCGLSVGGADWWFFKFTLLCLDWPPDCWRYPACILVRPLYCVSQHQFVFFFFY